jgi:hypothetical protein
MRDPVVAFAQILRQTCQDGAQGYRSLLSKVVVQSLLRLLAPEHLRALTAWPSLHGGGVLGAEALLTSIADLLYLPFTQAHIPQPDLTRLEQVPSP